jgi:membrane-bound hydrogenase subunit beta
MSDEIRAGAERASASAKPEPLFGADSSGSPSPEEPVRAIAAELQEKFSFPEGALKVQRATRLWAEVDYAAFGQVFDHLVKGMGFSILCTITGLDLGAELGFIYHLARDGGIMVNLKTKVPKGESIRSVTPYFPGADIYESELQDLLGARVDGKPVSPRYPLPEDWPQGDHPLLKDWKPKGAAAGATAAASTPTAAPGEPAAASTEKGASPNV